jgi:phosphate transport system permease protein
MNRDLPGRIGFGICAGIVIVLLFVVFVFIGSQAFNTFIIDHISFQDFFLNANWDNDKHFGSGIFIIGTLWLILLGLLIAVPLSLGGAIFITEIAPPLLARLLRNVVELFLGIPSVIFGFLGLILVVPVIANIMNYLAGGKYYQGSGIIAASIIVAFMVMPTITTIAIDALRAVPQDLREGSLALGATRWQTISKTLLPAALPGIITGVILGAARVMGETIAVAFVIGGSASFPLRIIDKYPYIYIGGTSVLTTPLLSFKEAPNGTTLYHALFTVSFTLLVISAIFVAISRAIASRRVYV